MKEKELKENKDNTEIINLQEEITKLEKALNSLVADKDQLITKLQEELRKKDDVIKNFTQY